MIDFRQVKEWAEYLTTRGWVYDFVKSADGKQVLQVLIFKVGFWPFKLLKLQRNEVDPDFADLGRVRKKHWVIQTVIEPLKIQSTEKYLGAGFGRSKYPFLATKTVVVDLSQSKECLWKNLSENAKRLIKNNTEVVIEKISPEEFHKLWKANSKVWVLSLGELNHLLEAFGGNACLCVSRDGKGYHSGLLSLCTKDTYNYFQTWTSSLGRESGAHYKLVWEEMLRAKAVGKRYFDFEGIFDEEFPIKKWRGFTEFKKKFGGEVVHHPGCYTRWF